MARPGSVTGLRRVPREAAEATKAACAASVRGDATALTAALRELTAVLRAPGSRAALLDARDATGETLLIHATRAGSEECVRLLLRHGASPHAADASGVTPLHVACAEADLRLVEAIVDSTARRPRGSFAIACTTLQLTPLHYLALSPKATSASPEVVHSIVRTIVEACSARAAFIRGHVANNSSAEPWVAFVHSTVDAYLYLAQGMTPLIAAAAAGSAPVVGALLRQCPETVRDAQTDTQFTALHWAAALSRDKCAMLLLAAEANPEARARCTRPGSGRECDVSARHIAEHGLTFLPSMPPPRDLRGLPVPNAERMLEVLDWAPAPAAERRIPDRVARTEAQRAVIWAEATEVDTTYRLVPHAGSRRGFGRRESDEEPVVTDETPAYHPEDDADEATRAAIDAETPDELRCPISLQLFRDPVIASDMHTYERRAIEAWQLKRGTSPLTGLDMPDVTVPLIPNVVFRNRADAIRARHGVKPGAQADKAVKSKPRDMPDIGTVPRGGDRRYARASHTAAAAFGASAGAGAGAPGRGVTGRAGAEPSAASASTDRRSERRDAPGAPDVRHPSGRRHMTSTVPGSRAAGATNAERLGYDGGGSVADLIGGGGAAARAPPLPAPQSAATARSRGGSYRAVARWTVQSTRHDELRVAAGEEVDVLGDPRPDGWVTCRAGGHLGLVPRDALRRR